METLLKPGDMIRIREDIEEGTSYRMILDQETANSWIADDMLPAGTLVKIISISSNQYIVSAVNYKHNSDSLVDDDFWLYTDQMFDPTSIGFLIGEIIEKDYF